MKELTRGVALFLSAALLCVLLIPAVKADQWNKRTMVTLNEPLEVPGIVLEPGTYIFQLADSQANRHIVQIWTGDGMYLIATIMALVPLASGFVGGSIPSMAGYVLAVVGAFRLARSVLAETSLSSYAVAGAWFATLVLAANPNLMAANDPDLLDKGFKIVRFGADR